jgi:hypothetical protein
VNETVVQREDRELEARKDTRLVEDTRQMAFDGFLTDGEVLRDFLIALTESCGTPDGSKVLTILIASSDRQR